MRDYIGGLTAKDAARKHGISTTTLHRRVRKYGYTLSPTERKRRRSKAGKKTQELHPHVRAHRCKAGCTCARHKPPNNRKHEIILGRKNCGHCGRWLYLLDFDPRERDIEGNAIAWQTTCKSCNRKRCRIYAGMKRRGKPYEVRGNRKSREEVNARKRERYDEMMKDPVWAEERREYARIYAHAMRRKRGVQSRKFIYGPHKNSTNHDPALPREPFVKWLEGRLKHYDGQWEALALSCGTQPRRLYAIRFGWERTQGKRQDLTHVRLGFVDSCLVLEGSTDLWEVYPHLYST